MFLVKEHAMKPDFEDLTRQVLKTALESLENIDEVPEDDIVTLVIHQALDVKLPVVDKIDGEWVMQMMWQVPDLLVNTEYDDGMDANKATWEAVRIRIADTIREDVTQRAGELGFDLDRMKI